MSNEDNNFPEYFPDGCPPKDAINKEIEVYRTCKNNKLEYNFSRHKR